MEARSLYKITTNITNMAKQNTAAVGFEKQIWSAADILGRMLI